MDRSDFGRRLREERQRLQLSAQTLADLGGVARVSQSHYETGRYLPDAAYLAAIHLIGVDTVYLLTGVRSALQPINWVLHNEILLGIDAWLDANDKTLPFGKKMQVLEVLMRHFTARGAAPDAGTLAEIIQLAA